MKVNVLYNITDNKVFDVYTSSKQCHEVLHDLLGARKKNNEETYVDNKGTKYSVSRVELIRFKKKSSYE